MNLTSEKEQKRPLRILNSVAPIRICDNGGWTDTWFAVAPAGASTGTSAAVTVTLIGALDCLTPGRLTPHEVAYMAQSIETDMLKQQCGIQDQLCSAYGGINYIEM